jgi:hypothetical protein
MKPISLRSFIPDNARFARVTRESTIDNPEDDMAKGQMRSNKEKKKPKQDKNIKKGGGAAPAPFANMHSQSGKKS